MLPTTTSRVYATDDADSAVVHVDAFGVDQHDRNGEGQGNEAGEATIMINSHDDMNAGGDDDAPQDDMNALYPIHRDQIPKIMRQVLAATGFLTLVTSPGNPNKLHLGAMVAFVLAGGTNMVLGFWLVFDKIFGDRMMGLQITKGWTS